jgi:hypothetical protein
MIDRDNARALGMQQDARILLDKYAYLGAVHIVFTIALSDGTKWVAEASNEPLPSRETAP